MAQARQHTFRFLFREANIIRFLDQHQPQIIAPWELIFFIISEILKANCQIFAVGSKGCIIDTDGLKFTMVEAFHSAGAQLTGFKGTNRVVGKTVVSPASANPDVFGGH